MFRSHRVPAPGPWKAIVTALACVLVLTAPGPCGAQPGDGDYGDAPDGTPAYPWAGVPGDFPTCWGGPNGHVRHANLAPVAYWGATMDTEPDGNAGFCPPGPYDLDECHGPSDGDAGLISPDPYSIVTGAAVACGGVANPRALGRACEMAAWGPAGLDLVVTNASASDMVVNVLFDWDQDGRWGGQSLCGTQLIPEHVVHNLLVPPHFSGPLSALMPPAFRIGPRDGFVWARFTISDPAPAVPLDWSGAEEFDSGETEDYLLRVDPYGGGGGNGDPGEYGDAPEGADAYPGVPGLFPTCVGGAAGMVYHRPTGGVRFGDALDWENDGNAGLCPPAPYDEDECHEPAGTAGADPGLLRPEPYTLDAAGTVRRCPQSAGGSIGQPCARGAWGPNLDVVVFNGSGEDRLVSALADWNRDGTWSPHVFTCPNGDTAGEQLLLNFPVPAGFNGPLSLLSPPDFLIGLDAGLAWFRFTLHDAPVLADWSGEGAFGDGETEDYLLAVSASATAVPDAATPRRLGLSVEPNVPNPFNPRTTIAFTLAAAGPVRVTVTDAAGREVARLHAGALPAGRHEVVWDGRRDDGGAAPSGVYIARVAAGGATEGAKMLLLR